MELKVLSHLDVARTQLYHFRETIVAGMGFLTDAYNVFCIPPISNLLEKLYYVGNMSFATCTAVNGIALCGILVGNIFFGRLGDRMDRKNVYGITLLLIMGGSFGSGFSLGKSPKLVAATLCFSGFGWALALAATIHCLPQLLPNTPIKRVEELSCPPCSQCIALECWQQVESLWSSLPVLKVYIRIHRSGKRTSCE
ncbi:hypothetical protein SUGI_0428500 [Cryptomeria japonica]|nr:hypothetical protein SUGI_0428500 [Cryptomeria japonica]